MDYLLMMEYLITQKQLRHLINESEGDNIQNDLQKLYQFTLDVIEKSQKMWNLNVRFLMTWGAAIGGMIMPLKSWIEGQHPELSEKQIILLLVGISCNYFYDNETFIRGILDKIKKEGLIGPFRKLFTKSEELKNNFLDFLNSIKVFGRSTSSLMAYAFILPILDDVISLISGSGDPEFIIKNIVGRIVASSVVLVGGSAVTSLISNIIKKYRD